jgi:integrase
MNTTYKLELNSKPKQDKTHCILLRITQNRKHTRISTAISVFKNEFNSKAEYGKWIRKSCIHHKSLNIQLEAIIQKAKDSENNLEKQNKTASRNSIKHELKSEFTESFIKYYEEKLENYYKPKSYFTYLAHKSKLKVLKEYLQSERLSDLSFNELTESFLADFDSYLRASRYSNDNTVKSYMKSIRAIFYMAYKKERIYQGFNPFVNYSVGSIKGNKQKLNLSDIKLITDIELNKGSLIWHTRNYFLFSYYTAGTRISDLMKLTWDNIRNGRLEYKADKTDKTTNILLLPEAMQILENYQVEKQGFIFPILNSNLFEISQKPEHKRTFEEKGILTNEIKNKTALLNKYLKQIQIKSGINVKISNHISRHSFANILLQKNVPINKIQGLLRHSSISMTENYLKALQSSEYDDAMTVLQQ